MALCDYRLCDVCDRKVFYDAELNYEEAPYGLQLGNLGVWVVICDHCTTTHRIALIDRALGTEVTPLQENIGGPPQTTTEGGR